MRPGNLVPSFYFYKFSEALSGPYTSLSAYTSGIIDSNGNILKPESSIDPFEYLIIKLKKIIEQLPYGMTKSQLGNYMSTIRMFSEELENYDITKDQFDCMMEGFFILQTNNKISYLELLEDMSVGGGGGAAGSLGTPIANSSTPTVSGMDPVLGMPMGRRKSAPKYFDNCEIFEVDPEEFMQLKIAKGWNEVPEGQNKNYLQRFQRRNKGKKVGVKSLNPLNGEHDLHWIDYPSPNFMGEELNLNNLLFLFEETDYSQKFRDQLSGLFKEVQEVKTSNKKNRNASVAELNARIFNHINNFTKVRSNPDALRHYMEHEGVRGILGKPESNSSDTHIITGFDEKNLPIIKTFDVKNVGSGKRKNVYVRQHLSADEISQVEQHSPNNAWVTERIQPKGLETSDRLYKKGTGVTKRLAQAVTDYLGQAKDTKDSLLKRLRERAQSKEYMIHENGRFYLVNHSHFDIDNPEVSANFGTPTYRTEGKRKQGASYIDPHENLRLARGQASIRAGLKDTFKDENNRIKLDTIGLKDIESMFDDETKKHFSDFVKTYS